MIKWRCILYSWEAGGMGNLLNAQCHVVVVKLQALYNIDYRYALEKQMPNYFEVHWLKSAWAQNSMPVQIQTETNIILTIVNWLVTIVLSSSEWYM